MSTLRPSIKTAHKKTLSYTISACCRLIAEPNLQDHRAMIPSIAFPVTRPSLNLLGADGRSLGPLRKLCQSLGYPAFDWGRGFNTGPQGDIDEWFGRASVIVYSIRGCRVLKFREAISGWAGTHRCWAWWQTDWRKNLVTGNPTHPTSLTVTPNFLKKDAI